jgi:hypothetical protein
MPVEERLPDFQRDLEGSLAAFFATLPDAPPIAQGARASKLMGIVDYPLYGATGRAAAGACARRGRCPHSQGTHTAASHPTSHTRGGDNQAGNGPRQINPPSLTVTRGAVTG